MLEMETLQGKTAILSIYANNNGNGHPSANQDIDEAESLVTTFGAMGPKGLNLD